MKKRWIALIAPPALVLFAWIFGEIVKALWNGILPALFGWHAITFWQALGLLVLSRILVGGLGNGGSGGPPRRRKGDQWVCMTPEEREQFRGYMRTRHGGESTPGGASGEPA